VGKTITANIYYDQLEKVQEKLWKKRLLVNRKKVVSLG